MLKMLFSTRPLVRKSTIVIREAAIADLLDDFDDLVKNNFKLETTDRKTEVLL